MDALHTLWTQAGLDDIRSREIIVTRDFDSFDDFWATNLLQPNIGKPVATMTQIAQDQLKSRVRSRLSIASHGRVSCSATANAITGRKSGVETPANKAGQYAASRTPPAKGSVSFHVCTQTTPLAIGPPVQAASQCFRHMRRTAIVLGIVEAA
jgi:hypothetical protein